MSSIYSAELAGLVSASKEPECEPSRSAKSMTTARASCKSIGPMFPTSETFAPSISRKALQKSSAVAFPARTLATPESVQGSKANAAGYGQNMPESLATFDPVSSSWKASQLCLDGELSEFSETWPRSGMMRNGIAYQLPTLALPITEIASGLLPTPSGVNGGKNHTVGRLDEWGGSSNPFRGTAIGKIRCAGFEEWMMGFPIGWTELTHYGMQSSRKSRKQSAAL